MQLLLKVHRLPSDSACGRTPPPHARGPIRYSAVLVSESTSSLRRHSSLPSRAVAMRGLSPRWAAAAGPAADQHQQRARGCGSAVLPPLTGRLRPKPKCIASMALRSKEPAPERRGVVKFLHVGLLLLKLPGARSSKEQVAVRGRHSRCWPADCLSGP